MNSEYRIKNNDSYAESTGEPFRSDKGFSLVEALVSMSIMVSVLLPVVLFLGYLVHTPGNQKKIKALHIAQAEMETALHEKLYEDAQWRLESDDRWIVRREIYREESLLAIEINVFRSDTTDTVITLRTERLYYEQNN